MIKSDSIVKISAALHKAQSEMGNAVKGASNPFFKSKYTDLNAVREACLPALSRNGITILQPTVTIDGKAYVETILLHESGEYIGGQTAIITKNDTDPQAHGSGVSYARRYGLNSLVCLGSEDDDGEAAMSRPKIQQKIIHNVVETKPVVEIKEEITTKTKFVKPSTKIIVQDEEVQY